MPCTRARFKIAPPQPPDMCSQNVPGLLPGDRSARHGEIILLAAHHDGQGMEGQTDPGRISLHRPVQVDHIWNSADDKASGVAALLEVARILSKSSHRLQRSVLFVSFNAEEHTLDGYRWLNDPSLPGPGGGGSEYYTINPPIPLSQHFAVIDLEILGRNPKESLRLYGIQKDFLQQAATLATDQTGLKVTTTQDVEECCDHIAFHRRGIPAVLVGVPGNRNHYHQADDDANRLREVGQTNFLACGIYRSTFNAMNIQQPPAAHNKQNNRRS
ncbi:MAG: M20/M25/M40 family metallo-hydrolase [Ignavibacteriales bacterium]|nr:M20/M25/M40 family metallo-hydrolase [Ignavibacteriales bacterium]